VAQAVAAPAVNQQPDAAKAQPAKQSKSARATAADHVGSAPAPAARAKHKTATLSHLPSPAKAADTSAAGPTPAPHAAPAPNAVPVAVPAAAPIAVQDVNAVPKSVAQAGMVAAGRSAVKQGLGNSRLDEAVTTPSTVTPGSHQPAETAGPKTGAVASATLVPMPVHTAPRGPDKAAPDETAAIAPPPAGAVLAKPALPAARTSRDSASSIKITAPPAGGTKPGNARQEQVAAGAAAAPSNGISHHLPTATPPGPGTMLAAASPAATAAPAGMAAALNAPVASPPVPSDSVGQPMAAPAMPPASFGNHAASLAAAVTAMVKDGKSSVSMRLDPPALGSVSIHLAVGQDAKVNVLMLAAVPQTAQAFSAGADDLRQAFAASGLALGHLDIGGGMAGGEAGSRQKPDRQTQAETGQAPAGKRDAADSNHANPGVRAIA
jgi:flagellar hook-length control protein FliK